jgi:peptidoglycan/xylan/chitin deacetylase (PgdA/CDA1 family)
VERVQAGEHAVITFDDGPDPDATPAVLDALDIAGVHATFFMVGGAAQRHPELAREVHLRGHEVALHCQEHRRQDKLRPTESEDDVIRGFATIEDIVGINCRWYRPPFGRMTAAALGACRELGMELVYWSAWGMDWERMPAERIAQNAAAELDDGAVLLLHDSARYGRRPTARPTAAAVSLIAARAAAKGIALMSLGEATADARV